MLATLLTLYASSIILGNDLDLSTVFPAEEKTIQANHLPQKDFHYIAPVIKAKSAIAIDLETGLVLFEKNSREHLPIASITKLMTIVITLENHHLDEIMTVSKKATQIEGSKAYLKPEEKLTVENLLYAALINSANDAAYALAENDSPDLKNFVEKMNQKASLMGLSDSHFTNPVGLDEKGNYSSAYDLTILAQYAYNKNFIQKAAKIKAMEISSADLKTTYKLKTTNDLLSSYLKVLGLKTGTTDEAGQCLVAIIENNEGHDILTVVLGSNSRYNETKILADWVFRAYTWT